MNCIQDNDGRMLMINLEIDNIFYSVVSLYAPNDKYNRKIFYESGFKWIKEHCLNDRNLYVAGDFNSYLRKCDKICGNIKQESDKGRAAFYNF